MFGSEGSRRMRVPCARLRRRGRGGGREQRRSRRRWFRVAGRSVPGLLSLVAGQANAMVPGALRIRAASEHYLIMYHVSIAQGSAAEGRLERKTFLSRRLVETAPEQRRHERMNADARPVSRIHGFTDQAQASRSERARREIELRWASAGRGRQPVRRVRAGSLFVLTANVAAREQRVSVDACRRVA